MKKPLDDATRKKHRKQRTIVYGGLLTFLVAGYYYQPNRIDIIPRHPPVPNPPVDPDSKRLFTKGTRVAIVTAHPDDAEFFLGGTLTKLAKSGAEITLIVCTSGDKSYYPWIGLFGSSFSGSGGTLAKVREGEQRAAFERWKGANLVFLHFPDGRLHANDDVKADVLHELLKARPEYVLAFDADYPPRVSHGDHRAAGEVVKSVIGETSAKWLLLFQTIAANYVDDISDQWDEKAALLALHSSQFNGKKLGWVTNMVQEMAMNDGEKIDKTYGEGFRAIKL